MQSIWQVQEAKNRLSELIDCALNEGPQTVTRHGRAVVRIVAVADAASATPKADDGFADYLLAVPRVGTFEAPARHSRKVAPVLGG